MNVFVLVFFPGCFLLVSLIVSKFAMAIGEQVEARVAEADQKHEDFGQIVEALKRREEEEVRLGFVGRDIHTHVSPFNQARFNHLLESVFRHSVAALKHTLGLCLRRSFCYVAVFWKLKVSMCCCCRRRPAGRRSQKHTEVKMRMATLPLKVHTLDCM